MAAPSGAAAPDTFKRSRRRRRPSGAPPPLPRSVGRSGILWLVALLAFVLWGVVVSASEGVRDVHGTIDAAVLRQFARLRTDWLTSVLREIDDFGSGWAASAYFLVVVIVLIVFKRWRHLFTLLGAIAVIEVGAGIIYTAFERPRPYDVTIIADWAGYSIPAPPVVIVAMCVIGTIYALVPAGHPRQVAKVIGAIVLAVFAFAQLYLALYHPLDVVIAIALTAAVMINAFRFFTPNESFPVTYHKGKTAHLDISGRRGEAIRQALHDQLGVTVVDVQPVGLAGSGGSTPLRIRAAGDPDTYVFGKLYSMTHVRADRWYKLGRTLLYGRLEDEASFRSVLRLVEYEDYAQRIVRDAGIHTAAPMGIVELTPGREYMLVTEFFDNAREIGDADVDDGVIDEGLSIVRKLWDAGLAHRDIKPANLLVRDGHVLVIDVAFVQVRPSPWRQAIDLANMMLVLAVRNDAQNVYERALQFFTADEIAEAFAAARGIASPSQLRTMMKQDDRDLLAEFRALAPERQPVSLQRWNFRRVALSLAVIVGLVLSTLVLGSQLKQMLEPADDVEVTGTPNCGTGNLMILMAQSVPSATALPCIAALPAGWEMGGVKVRNGRASFWLDSDRGGARAIEATLLPPDECSVENAIERPTDEPGTQRFDEPEAPPPALRLNRYYLFPGGCVRYRFSFESDTPVALLAEGASALGFQSRAELVDYVHDRNGLNLCGAGAPPCVGGS